MSLNVWNPAVVETKAEPSINRNPLIVAAVASALVMWCSSGWGSPDEVIDGKNDDSDVPTVPVDNDWETPDTPFTPVDNDTDTSDTPDTPVDNTPDTPVVIDIPVDSPEITISENGDSVTFPLFSYNTSPWEDTTFRAEHKAKLTADSGTIAKWDNTVIFTPGNTEQCIDLSTENENYEIDNVTFTVVDKDWTWEQPTIYSPEGNQVFISTSGNSARYFHEVKVSWYEFCSAQTLQVLSEIGGTVQMVIDWYENWERLFLGHDMQIAN